MRKLLAAVALAVVFGACGRGGTVTVDSGSRPPSVQDDRAAASRLLLTASDLPGFVPGEQVPPEPTTVKAASSFESCAGAGALLQDGERMVLSPGYFKGQTAAVSSLAMVAATEDQARKAMADLGRAEMGRCITGLFSSVLGLDQSPGTTTKTDLGPSNKLGDQTVTWHTTIHVDGPHGGMAYASLTFVRTGRAVGSLFDFQLGTPFSAAERARLLGTLTDRSKAI